MTSLDQGFSFDKFTDDHVLRKLPTIRRSRGRFCLPTIRRSQDGFGRFCSPTIRRSHLGFFAESYRRSDDHNWVFFAKVTDDPTITFRFFCRKLPTIRRSLSTIRRSLPTIRRSSFTDDPTIIFLIIFTDDPTIIWKIFTDDPTIMNMVFLAKSYRRSDDHDMDFLAKVTDDPTITVFNFVPDSCQNWNPELVTLFLFLSFWCS